MTMRMEGRHCLPPSGTRGGQASAHLPLRVQQSRRAESTFQGTKLSLKEYRLRDRHTGDTESTLTLGLQGTIPGLQLAPSKQGCHILRLGALVLRGLMRNHHKTPALPGTEVSVCLCRPRRVSLSGVSSARAPPPPALAVPLLSAVPATPRAGGGVSALGGEGLPGPQTGWG